MLGDLLSGVILGWRFALSLACAVVIEFSLRWLNSSQGSFRVDNSCAFYFERVGRHGVEHLPHSDVSAARRLTIVGGVREALLARRLGRREIVRPRRQGPALLRGPSTSPLEAAARNGQEDETPTCEELVQRTFDRGHSLRARSSSARPSVKRAPGASVCARD